MSDLLCLCRSMATPSGKQLSAAGALPNRGHDDPAMPRTTREWHALLLRGDPEGTAPHGFHVFMRDH